MGGCCLHYFGVRDVGIFFIVLARAWVAVVLIVLRVRDVGIVFIVFVGQESECCLHCLEGRGRGCCKPHIPFCS